MTRKLDVRPIIPTDRCRLWLLVAALVVWGWGMSWAGGYETVAGPCGLQFPADHGMHPGFRTEWWYYTGNVAASGGHAFGFQLTFFRTRIRPPSASDAAAAGGSPWRTDQLFLVHAAVTDIDQNRHLQAQDIERGALGLAGVDSREGRHRVFVDNWEAIIGPGAHRLNAVSDAFSIDLELVPLKPPVLHGENGYSRKGGARENASCYYSLTRMQTRGTLTVDGVRYPVSGLSWMDHEYSTAPLEKGIAGWDWFSLQLDNQEEIMIFLLRRSGSGDIAYASGTRVMPDGRSIGIARQDIHPTVTDRWRSGRSGATYPSGWRLDLNGEGYSLVVTPCVADQEMHTRNTTGVVYWEGSVRVRGARDGSPVTGAGYVELTGYASDFDAPL